jgi:hypothetical protein
LVEISFSNATDSAESVAVGLGVDLDRELARFEAVFRPDPELALLWLPCLDLVDPAFGFRVRALAISPSPVLRCACSRDHDPLRGAPAARQAMLLLDRTICARRTTGGASNGSNPA